MNTQIKKILADLYIIDGSLREREEELINIINNILISQPDTKFDAEFARRLRFKLLEKESLTIKKNFNFTIMSDLIIKRFSYVFAGAAVILLAVVVWQNIDFSSKNSLSSKITKLKSNAFGSLIENGQLAVSEELASANVSVTKGSAESRAIGMGGGGGVSVSDAMLPNPVNYIYKYTGEEIKMESKEITVFRRVRGGASASALANQIKGFDFGGVNLNNFSNLSLQNLTLAEDKEFGYMLSFSLEDGSISINQNWLKWPNTQDICLGKDSACFDSLQLTPNDIPSDSVIIEIVDNFLREKGISIDGYGAPFIDKSWITPEVRFIGDQLSVIYPLIIEGSKVYEESGQPSGLNISIDIRNKRVAGVWNMLSQVYESSDYAAETDFNRIKEIAEKGGRYNNIYYADLSGQETNVLELGTPEFILARIWKQPAGYGMAQEFFIPSYFFPIINKPDNAPTWINGVVVPLAKEILDDADKNNDINPRPMPLLDPASTRSEQPAVAPEDFAADEVCADNCGNGICEEVTCQGTDCPCIETEKSCVVDCS